MPEARLNLPFTGLVSFMRVPAVTEFTRLDADIAILGAPTDEGSPWKPGARFAPRKIREISVKYAGYGPVQNQKGYYDIDEDRRFLEYERQNSRIVDCGDVDIIYTNFKQTFDNITARRRADPEAPARFPSSSAGDHAITYPVVRAYEERLNVVHFDAQWTTGPSSTACSGPTATRSGTSRKLKTCHHIIQVGIRSLRTARRTCEDSRRARQRHRDGAGVPPAGPRAPSSTACRGRAGLRVDRHRRAGPPARARLRLVGGQRARPTTSSGRRCSRSPAAAR